MKTLRNAALLVLAALVLFAQGGAAQSDEKKKWDVTAPLGPTSKVEFDTSEGTWMNVDVSPDGKTIVFDLFGDIYAMPVAGSGSSRATRLTSEPAFDVQPRFSPDGKLIAFTSDRDGLTNIWVMSPDGKGPRQVTKETRWFINSPTWSPDGQYIFSRKHFVKERSLGSGEIWMHHVSGSEGLQVTEKNGWQKDAGETAISPDGKYLYYSKDVTPGESFEYNKDPYGVIYAIFRRDLTTGKEEQLLGRPGGSITPRPSPDGKQLAFVRRVGLKSMLFVHDLASGREWPIFDGLDKDLQEAWAVHGVYPQYGWTPDGAAIVIWGQGKIWRVDVAAKKGTEIPFTAHVEQTLNAALRFPQKVHPDEFPTRMLRDVTTSPDGKMVIYGALGHLYVKSLPDGQPHRLTKAAPPAMSASARTVVGTTGVPESVRPELVEGRTNAMQTDSRDAAPAPQGEGGPLEFSPAFSADGSWIVYTTWTDADAGRVRIVHPDGTGGRDIVTEPGHYTEASFSPDAKWIVYRKAGEDDIRGITYAEQPGIYLVAVDGSAKPRRVTDSGSAPMFDHTGERLYLRDRKDDKFQLKSVNLTGGDEVVHLQSENATQIVPSPDGKWIAFAERYHAFIGAFPHSGRPIDLSEKTAAYPVARISRDAGMYLHWSGDSKRVYWSLGPELFSRDLPKTFTFVDEAADKPAEPEVKGIPIGFTVKSDVPSGTIAFVGARIITMTGSGAEASSGGRTPGVIENGTIVVERNRIVAIGPASSVKAPAGATVVNAAGKTIMPGIIDVHAHVGGEGDGILAESSWPLLANLAFGVTTSHDPSNDTETVFTNAEMIRAGMKLGPRLFSTGTVLYGAETSFKAVVESYEDAASHLRRMKAVGAFSVKSYNQQRRDARQMIIKAARDLEMMVVPEGGSLVYMNEAMILDGHTGIEHSLPVPILYKDVATIFGKSQVGYTPTLIVGYGGLSGENYWYQHSNVWENKRLMTFTPRDIVEPRSRRRGMAAEDDFNHVLLAKSAKKVLDAGGSVQLGAHGQLQGLGAHWELWMLQQGGMTNMEALRCATINGAKYLGLDADIGSLEKGKLADLIVLDRNPLENIRNSESVNQVMVNGRLYDAATLNELGNHPRTRGQLWWERAPTQ